MKQNEIWLINLEPTVGAEIKKTRPAIIVSDNALGKLPFKIIVPITADCFQVRSISTQRFIKKIGLVNASASEKIKSSLSKVLSIS